MSVVYRGEGTGRSKGGMENANEGGSLALPDRAERGS